MIGMQRSGSNLLRLILNNSSHLTAPHPPHILPRFDSLVSTYGDLDSEGNFHRLVKDVCELVDLNPVRWNNYPQDVQHVTDGCRNKTLMAIHESLMNEYASSQNSEKWICKSRSNEERVDEFLAYYENPKFVFLVRDPRDVVLSFQNTLIGHKHPYFIAKKWSNTQRKCLGYLRTLGEEKVHLLKYEDLIHRTEHVIRDLCGFLNIPFEIQMLDYHKSDDARKAASVSQQWGNVTKPIMHANSNKFEMAMSQEDVRLIETICNEEMKSLGYPLKNTGALESIDSNQISEFSRIDTDLKNEVRSTFDEKDIESRRRQEELLERIYNARTGD